MEYETLTGDEIKAVIKGVNNKFLDTSIRLPRSFLFAEETIKQAVSSHISRGKVDVFVTIDSSMADDMIVRVNEPLLKGYLDALNTIADKYKSRVSPALLRKVLRSVALQAGSKFVYRQEQV